MRVVAEHLAAEWKTAVIIDNKPGAGTTLGAQSVATAAADGYTLFANTASFLITPHLMSRRPYDAIADFVPVARLASSPHVLVVGNQVPANSLPGFVAWAKGRPQPATFASFGTGSSSHLGFEILRHRLGLEMVHVPYRGAAPALLDILGERVDAMLADLSTVAEQVKSGRVRALAITGAARTSLLPGIPTMDEAGLKGFRSESWFGLVARTGTLPEIIARWEKALADTLTKSNVTTKLDTLGISPAVLTSRDFALFMAEEDGKYLDAISGATGETKFIPHYIGPSRSSGLPRPLQDHSGPFDDRSYTRTIA